MSFSVICISATDGANAGDVAKAVGQTTGFPVVDEEIVVRAAAEAGVDRQAIASVENCPPWLLETAKSERRSMPPKIVTQSCCEVWLRGAVARSSWSVTFRGMRKIAMSPIPTRFAATGSFLHP